MYEQFYRAVIVSLMLMYQHFHRDNRKSYIHKFKSKYLICIGKSHLELYRTAKSLFSRIVSLLIVFVLPGEKKQIFLVPHAERRKQ